MVPSQASCSPADVHISRTRLGNVYALSACQHTPSESWLTQLAPGRPSIRRRVADKPCWNCMVCRWRIVSQQYCDCIEGAYFSLPGRRFLEVRIEEFITKAGPLLATAHISWSLIIVYAFSRCVRGLSGCEQLSSYSDDTNPGTGTHSKSLLEAIKCIIACA